MPDPQPQALHQPSRRLRRAHSAVLIGWPTSLAPPFAPGGLLACHGIHRPPGPKGRADRPARQPKGARTMTEAASASPATSPTTPSCDTPRAASPGPGSGWPSQGGGSRSRRSSPSSPGATRPSTPPSRCTGGAGSWLWASSSSGPGRLRTGAPGRWSRSWPRSWGRALVGDGDIEQGGQAGLRGA